jgi:hypothetical protein
MVREKEATFLLRQNLAGSMWTPSPSRKMASKAMTDMNFLYAIGPTIKMNLIVVTTRFQGQMFDRTGL